MDKLLVIQWETNNNNNQISVQMEQLDNWLYKVYIGLDYLIGCH